MGQSPACPAVSSRDPAPRPASTAARGLGAPSAPGPSQGVVVRLPLHALDAVPAGPRSRGARHGGACPPTPASRPSRRSKKVASAYLSPSAPHPSHPEVAQWRRFSNAGVGAHPEVTRQPPLSAPPTPLGRDGGGPTVLRASSTASRPRSGWPLARIPAEAAAPGRLLRLFSSATPLRPPLYEKKGRSGGRKSEVEGKGRSRHRSAGRVPRRGGGSRGTLPRRVVFTYCEGGVRSRWGAWDSWDESGRGRVQICHKGAPGWDQPREEARNINDSPPVPRRDPGLCGRFGQLAARIPWEGLLAQLREAVEDQPLRAPRVAPGPRRRWRRWPSSPFGRPGRRRRAAVGAERAARAARP